MQINELIQQGKLAEARSRLVAEVKKAPADARYRSLLAQVLLFDGEWDKAQRHFELSASMDSARNMAAELCKGAIAAERERRQVIDGKELPSCLPEPPDYFEPYHQACQVLRDGNAEQAGELFVAAGAPVLHGRRNGNAFEGFGNTDIFLQPFLEAFAHGRYVWIPLDAIRELVVAPPSTLLDLLWTQASVTTWTGLSMNCHLPVLYPGTPAEADEALRMGRRTEWRSVAGSFARGIGQQVFEVGGEDISLLELGTVQFKMNREGENDGPAD